MTEQLLNLATIHATRPGVRGTTHFGCQGASDLPWITDAVLEHYEDAICAQPGSRHVGYQSGDVDVVVLLT